jgi:hypothetical protein
MNAARRELDETIRCDCCGKEKPRSEFYKNATYTAGVTARCKTCLLGVMRAKYHADSRVRARRIANARAWQRKHPARSLEIQRKSHRKNRAKNSATQRTRREKTNRSYDASWRIENRTTIRGRAIRYIRDLRPWYTRSLLIGRSPLSPADLPFGLIETHAANLKLKRLCQLQKTSPNLGTSSSINSKR